jgi:hypothetical protein
VRVAVHPRHQRRVLPIRGCIESPSFTDARVNRYLRLFRVAALAPALLSDTAAFAYNLRWTGTVNNLWNTADANWAGGKVFANGDSVLFSGTGGQISPIVNLTRGTNTDHVSVAIPPLGPSGFVRLSASE